MDRPPPLINAVYYPSWRVYKDIPPSSLPLHKISTIFYAFAIPNEDGTLRFLDEYADTKIPVDAELGCLNALARVKRDNRHLRTILSIGGGAGSGAFSTMTASKKKRATFAQTALEWVLKYSFDGIDVDWEHPMTLAEGSQFMKLLHACRDALPSPRYLLTTALPIDPNILDLMDLRGISEIVDHINLMCYDYVGPWSHVAGHHAQLHLPPGATTRPTGPDGQMQHLVTSSETGLKFLFSRAVPPNRILMGIPAYARIFPGAGYEGDRYLKQDPKDDNREEEVEIDYRDVPEAWKKEGVLQIDTLRAAAWAVVPSTGKAGGKSFVTMDVPETVRIKARFVRETGLGGLFYWTGAGDAVGDGESLVVAGFDALHGN